MERLKRRRDFLAAAKGQRASRRSFLLQRRQRDEDGLPRIGFTVTKKTAVKAVERNRIRRRLREAARLVDPSLPQAGFDYVLVGRRGALSQAFDEISADLAIALADPSGRRGEADARGPR